MNDDTPQSGGPQYGPRDLIFGLTPDDLKLDVNTLDAAPDLGWSEEMMDTILNSNPHDLPALDGWADVIMHHALMLFHHLMNDPAYIDIHVTDLFGACLYQARVWANG